MLLILVLIILCVGFSWLHLPLKNWLITSSIVLALGLFSGVTNTFFTFVFLAVFVVITLILFYLPDLRKQHVSARLLNFVKAAMPTISKTEREAIEAGTVWWDAELFSGAPKWDVLLNTPPNRLSEEESAFINGPLNELCEGLDDWQVTHELNDLTEASWKFIREQGFFGMNASKEFNGLGFSAHAQSTILQTLSTRSATAAVTVMVPNSLGPAELLYHYGTDSQKKYYLPRLANGQEIPCFGLTGPWAGSDADGMPDCGFVCEREYEGKTVLGFSVTWEKRYITLGPVATLLGLAFKAFDPDHLLGGDSELGITCALVPTNTPGVNIGERHLPLNSSFQNGPNSGNDVFIPLDWVIGGEEMVGQGWRMLMESLSAGRGISLPAAAAGAAKLATRTSSAYVKIREQFGIEIGKFEGVQEVLARMAGLTYLLDSGRSVMTACLSEGHKPSIISAIVKQQCTDLSRIVVNDAMDLHGGKGICMGPSNYLARIYQQIPIGITVEGANILTRSLIIFGQGAMRCHPCLLKEIEAAANEDESEALDEFDIEVTKHIEHIIGNKIRAFSYGLSRGWLAKGIGSGSVFRYSRTIEHFSAALAYLTDVTLFVLGGDLKRKEMLSGRFADVLSNLYLASAAIKNYRDNGEPPSEKPLLDWSCQYALYQAQQALDGILKNYPIKFMGRLLRITIFPSGRYLSLPMDQLSKDVSQLMQTTGPVRDRLTEEVFIPEEENEIVRKIENAFVLCEKTCDLRKKLKKETEGINPGESYDQWLNRLQEESVISADENRVLSETRTLVADVIAVDSF